MKWIIFNSYKEANSFCDFLWFNFNIEAKTKLQKDNQEKTKFYVYCPLFVFDYL